MAKHPVYPDSFVRHDIVASDTNDLRPGPADLVVFASGPAGVSTLTVADGIEISVDYATPSQLCLAALASDVDRRSLAALVGDSRLHRALQPNRGRPIRVENLGERSNTVGPRLRRMSTDPLPEEAAQRFGRLVTIADIATDPSESDLVRAVAAVEFFVESDDGALPMGALSPRVVDRAATVAPKLLGSAGDQIDALSARDPELARRVAALLRRSGLDVGEVIPALERVAPMPERQEELVSAAEDFDLPAAAMAPPILQSRASARPEEPPKRWDFLAPPDPMVRFVGEGRVLVTSEQPTAHRWCRVLDGSGGLGLLAIVPITPVSTGRSKGWRAEALVPLGLDADDLIVETVGDTSADVPVPTGSVEQVIDAVALGRDAVELDMRGAGSREAWRACARAWSDLGDEARANRALAYAEGRISVQRRPALADLVRWALEAS